MAVRGPRNKAEKRRLQTHNGQNIGGGSLVMQVVEEIPPKNLYPSQSQ